MSSKTNNPIPKNNSKNIKACLIYIPKFEFCTDNAAMIAIAGYYKYLNNDYAMLNEVASARLKF